MKSSLHTAVNSGHERKKKKIKITEGQDAVLDDQPTLHNIPN